MGMGAGAAETELTMREEHFKVGAESDGRKVEFFQKDKHQPSHHPKQKCEIRKQNKDITFLWRKD